MTSKATYDHVQMLKHARTIEVHAEEHRTLLGENLDMLDKHNANLAIIEEELELVNEYVDKSTKIIEDVKTLTSSEIMANLKSKMAKDKKRRDRLRREKDTLTKLIALLKRRIAVHRKVVDRYERNLK